MANSAAGVDHMKASRRRTTEPSGAAPAQRLGRVLVVEDEQDVAELIRYNLAKEGYDVRVSGNGADALRQAREARPELILLDIMNRNRFVTRWLPARYLCSACSG